ncbi:DUF3087 domain-containing protein [Pseudomonas sp. ABC1]|uniref:DUF3087 domain-containing protein n=1 Tax=Pseudomonas sp. ABC1 TaxID=2748080 RepID=UPI0015C2D610|nr:DUF3087 domain-containing protein [Pseudomonas sp. ABC1]QLF94510.1 DUF3087 domain-containing protein [Pseudomonas sp. ABC1]
MTLFEIQPMEPQRYRQQTRRITLLVVVIFAALGLGLSTLAVQLFGTPEGDNFRLNVAGVLVGLLASILLIRFVFWPRPWMAPAVYGWRLKRSLMRVTNRMHLVRQAVAADDPSAMKLLRFYHLGVIQMCSLDGNPNGLDNMVHEIDRHLEHMLRLGLEPEQNRLEGEWLEALKGM